MDLGHRSNTEDYHFIVMYSISLYLQIPNWEKEGLDGDPSL